MIESEEKQQKGYEQSEYRICSLCGREFDTPAEASKHMTIEHLQKGEIPE